MTNNKFSFSIEGILYEGTFLPPFQALKWGPKASQVIDQSYNHSNLEGNDLSELIDELLQKTIVTATDPNINEKFKLSSAEEFNIWFSDRKSAMFAFTSALITHNLTPFLSSESQKGEP